MTSRARKYIFFTADGEMGNQLFQAAFLEGTFAKGDRLVAMGLEHMLEGFDWTPFELTHFENLRSRRALKRFLRMIARGLVKIRLIDGYAQKKVPFHVDGQDYWMAGYDVTYSKGLFSRIVWVDKGYFERKDIVPHGSFKLKPQYFDAAKKFLATLPPGKVAFVHVRRGNLMPRKIFGHSPVLNIDYFERGMAEIRAVDPDTQFVLISDGIDQVAPQFEGSGVHVFRGANMYEDFALMMLSDGGVISSSTFSLWGAYFSRRTLPVISPKNWHGCTVGFEYPVGVTTDWMQPIEP